MFSFLISMFPLKYIHMGFPFYYFKVGYFSSFAELSNISIPALPFILWRIIDVMFFRLLLSGLPCGFPCGFIFRSLVFWKSVLGFQNCYLLLISSFTIRIQSSGRCMWFFYNCISVIIVLLAYVCFKYPRMICFVLAITVCQHTRSDLGMN